MAALDESFSSAGHPMKKVFIALTIGIAGVGELLRAAQTPAATSERQSPPATPGFGQGRGQWDDPRFIEDRKWFHFLLDNRAKIKRTITRTEKGVDVLTESDDPEVAAGIQTHVAAMHARVKEGRGIHMRDPLFREVFRHADKISMEITDTDKGVRVVETSEDSYVASLIQAHADVVSKFVENGHDEVRKNHAVPPRND